MPRCLLIDLDGVVRVWDPTLVAEVERRHALAAGSVAAAAFGDGSRLREVVTGRISDEQWRAHVVRRLEPLCGPAAQEVVDDWSGPIGDVDADVLAVVRASRRAGWRIGLLTNATSRLDDDLARLGLHEEFDAVLNSSELGACKPDPAVFEAACRRLGVDASACVFVDDSPANVAGAAAAGMDAHLHQDAQTLAALLGVAT